MSDKLTAEEIAKQIREEVATGKYGFVKAVSRALEKHARQEVDEATKPLVEAVEKSHRTLTGVWVAASHKFTEAGKKEIFESKEACEQALTAHYEKYPKERSA